MNPMNRNKFQILVSINIWAKALKTLIQSMIIVIEII
jgi:hypothetical protein